MSPWKVAVVGEKSASKDQLRSRLSACVLGNDTEGEVEMTDDITEADAYIVLQMATLDKVQIFQDGKKILIVQALPVQTSDKDVQSNCPTVYLKSDASEIMTKLRQMLHDSHPFLDRMEDQKQINETERPEKEAKNKKSWGKFWSKLSRTGNRSPYTSPLPTQSCVDHVSDDRKIHTLWPRKASRRSLRNGVENRELGPAPTMNGEPLWKSYVQNPNGSYRLRR